MNEGNEGQAALEQAGEAEKKSHLKTIEARLNQSYASRLAEYITGFPLESAQLVEKLVEDQLRIRQKYALPSFELLRNDPAEYERQLRSDAQKMGVSIREVSDCGTFFKEYSASAVFTGESNTIGATVRRDEGHQYSVDLKTLEHEFVHSRQHAEAPRMSIELQEYEAYVANLPITYLREHPEDALKAVFGFFIPSSVNTWYRMENDNRKEGSPELEPVWDDPKYFLKNVDHITDQDIQALIDQIRKENEISEDSPQTSDDSTSDQDVQAFMDQIRMENEEAEDHSQSSDESDAEPVG